MSEARIFFDFFLEQRVLRFHRGIVHPPAAIIDRATRADRPDGNPPGNRLVRGFLALLAFSYSFWAAAVSYNLGPRSPRTRAAERRRGARVPVRTRTRPVVPPPYRGPAVVAIRWPFGVLTRGSSRPGGSGRPGGLGAKIARFLAQGTPPGAAP